MMSQEPDSQDKQSENRGSHPTQNQAVKISHSDQHSRPHSQPENQPPQEPPHGQEVDIFNQPDANKQILKLYQRAQFPGLLRFLDSGGFQGFVTLLTIYALFGDDIRVMGFDKDADIGFDALNIICLITFSFEVILSVIAKPGYVFSFFFWLDSISTISLLLDIQLFTIAIGLSGQAGSPKKASSLARAGRASRIGTRAGRVVRLVRLIRIAKLYKTASKSKKSKAQLLIEERRKRKRVHPGTKEESPAEDLLVNQVDQVEQPENEEDEENKEFKESRVSKALSDLTTKRVIIIILLLLFLVPLFELSYYGDPPNSMTYQTKFFSDLAYNKNSDLKLMQETFNQILEDHDNYGESVVYFNVPFPQIKNYQADVYDILRADDMNIGIDTFDMTKYQESHPDEAANIVEMKLEISTGLNSLDIVAISNLKPSNQIHALISFMRTIFVCMVLTFGSLMFSKDANDLALRPIERMIDKVNKIARNPNMAVELRLAKDQNNNNETIKIENAVIKIGMLLALGFGDAGSEIIGSNMAKSGDVDPMLPGKKKCAIYGFCDIRNFTDATEQLQEDVMLFVNNIAEIVHAIVDRYAGAANKNIGDAFLLVWKMNPDKYTINDDGSVDWKDRRYVEILADCALISFMKIQAKINREPKILAYRNDARLLKRMPGYKVKMGFGLHLGWGIEGAIGSEFKIDASYLSPNVNMASRLEAATKQYGVPLLISSALQENFSQAVQFYTRQIDKVTVKGSVQPIGFYTIDMDCDHLPPSKDPDTDPKYIGVYRDAKEIKDARATANRTKKQVIMALVEAGELDGAEFIEENKDLMLIMKSFQPEFNDKFNEAFKTYLDGNWSKCKELLLVASQLKPDDGPTKTLMDVMAESKFQAPSTWKGYRELTEK